MKTLIISFLVFTSIVNATILESRTFISVSKLILTDERINELLYSISINKNYDENNTVYVVRIEKVKNFYELRLAELQKKDFSWYLFNKKDNLVGFFEYKSKLVLVYGKCYEEFFKTSKVAKSFDFLTINKKTSQKRIGIPINFEPEVWVYHITEQNILLNRKGQFRMLK